MTNTQNINNNLSNLTLVIPAKEETDCLWHVLEELQNYNFQKIIVIPTNRSLPNNWAFQNIKIINQSKNGYGNALLEGIENVKTKYFCIFNADGSFNPKEINNMLNLTDNYDFIFGSRYIKNGKSDDDTFLTIIGNYIFSKIGKIFFNIHSKCLLTEVATAVVIGRIGIGCFRMGSGPVYDTILRILCGVFIKIIGGTVGFSLGHGP